MVTETDGIYLKEEDYRTHYIFRFMLEQVLDTYGVDEGTVLIRDMFEDSEEIHEFITVSVDAYQSGKRISDVGAVSKVDVDRYIRRE